MAIALQSRRGVGHLLRTYTNTWGLPLGGYEPFGNPSTGRLSVRTHNMTTYDWKIAFCVKVWSLSGADCVLR